MAITRVWQTGAEARSYSEVTGNTAVFYYSANYAKGGTTSFMVRADVVSNCYKTIPDTAQIRVGFHNLFKYGLGNIADGDTLIIYDGATALIEIEIDRAGSNLRLKVAGAEEDITTDSPIELLTWYHIGLDCKIDSVNGWAYVYLDGVEILSFDGDTGSVNIDKVLFGTATDASSIVLEWYYDNLYIDDTTGEASPVIVPMLNFQWIYPNGTGNYDQWIGSDGNNTNNYLLVDESPPVTTDYVEEDTADQFDSYAMTTYTLGAGETINAVIPIVFAQRYGAAEELALGTRYSGTNAIGSEQDPGSGAWTFSWERQTTKPGGGVWDQAALDGVEVVIYSTGTF